MKFIFTFLLFLFCCNCAYSSNYDTLSTQAHVFATFYDSVDDVLYAGGTTQMLKFQNNSWAYFSPAPPYYGISSIVKYNNELYVAGGFGVARFNGTSWITLPASPLTGNYDKKLFVYNNKLYVFNGVLYQFLNYWDGSSWIQEDPGVSSMGCYGATILFLYNNELYANSKDMNAGGASVVIKKTGNQWIYPNGFHFNQGVSLHCELNNNLYVTSGSSEAVWEFNGLVWKRLNFVASGATVFTEDIRSMRSDGTHLFLSGRFNHVHILPTTSQVNVNNIFRWCGDDLISPIETGLPNAYYIEDFNFYNNKLYVFGTVYAPTAPMSVIDSISDMPEPSIYISDTAFCLGDVVHLSETSGSGSQWEWIIDSSSTAFPNEQHISVWFSTPGDHTVKVKVTNCAGASTTVFPFVIHVYPNPPMPTIQVLGDTLFSSSPYNNHWIVNGVEQPDTLNYLVITLDWHTYVRVTVRDQYGCSATSDFVTQIENHCNDTGFEIFPNPNQGFVTINSKSLNPGNYLLTVKTIHGQLVLAKEIQVENNCSVDLTGLQSGLYLMTLQSETELYTRKIVVQK